MTVLQGLSDTFVECDLAFLMPDIFPAEIYRNQQDDFHNIGNRTGGTDEVDDGCSSCLSVLCCVLILLTPADGRGLLCDSNASFDAVSMATAISKAFLYLISGSDKRFF